MSPAMVLYVKYCIVDQSIDVLMIYTKYLGLFFFSNIEAVSRTVPQTERQDSHDPWHTWNSASQEDPRGCQWGGHFHRREDRAWNPRQPFSLWFVCFLAFFSLVDLQIRLLQDAGPHDLTAIHTPSAPLPLRGRHHQRRKHFILSGRLLPRGNCIQHLRQPVVFY